MVRRRAQVAPKRLGGEILDAGCEIRVAGWETSDMSAFAAKGVGVLLWPAVVVHAILIILLLRARSRERMSGVGDMSARTDHVPFPGRRQ